MLFAHQQACHGLPVTSIRGSPWIQAEHLTLQCWNRKSFPILRVRGQRAALPHCRTAGDRSHQAPLNKGGARDLAEQQGEWSHVLYCAWICNQGWLQTAKLIHAPWISAGRKWICFTDSAEAETIYPGWGSDSYPCLRLLCVFQHTAQNHDLPTDQRSNMASRLEGQSRTESRQHNFSVVWETPCWVKWKSYSNTLCDKYPISHPSTSSWGAFPTNTRGPVAPWYRQTSTVSGPGGVMINSTAGHTAGNVRGCKRRSS